MFAFGDSCNSGDDKYVLAQFRADADLSWVAALRSFLDIKELKHKDYVPQRHRVAGNTKLSQRMHTGLAQAEITIVDRPKYQRLAFADLWSSGAELWVDFDMNSVNERAAELMISDSPIGMIYQYGHRDWLFDRMSDNTGLSTSRTQTFTPSTIREASGGKLRDAVVLSARSHAMLSPTETWETIGALSGWGPTNIGKSIERLQKMGRTFDTEHAKSLAVLNTFVDNVAAGSHIHRGLLPMLYKDRSPVDEQSSTQVDHIQAADFAAGWVADLLIGTEGDYRVVAKKFRAVLVNGIIVPE